MCTLDVDAVSSRDNHWSSDSRTIKTYVQKPSGIPIHSHMRGGRLDNAKARKLCTKLAGSILKYFGIFADRRMQAPKKYDQQTLSKESDQKVLLTPAILWLWEIPRILFKRCHNVSVRVGALCILWCPDLLIVNKSFTREKRAREYIESVVSRKRK